MKIPSLALLIVAALAAAPADACQWHALAGQALAPGRNVKRVLIVQQVDRMTGLEATVKVAGEKAELPTKYGFHCELDPAGGTATLNCERQGDVTSAVQSCTGPDAALVKSWDGFDRLGVNVVSVVLVCVPEDLAGAANQVPTGTPTATP